MLSQADRQLIASAIDGCLLPRDDRALRHLLSVSPEARLLLQQLQEDANRIQRLARPALGVDLTQSVLRKISSSRVETRLRPAPEPLVTWPRAAVVAHIAAAAAIFLAVGAASHLTFLAPADKQQPINLIRTPAENINPVAKLSGPTESQTDSEKRIVKTPLPVPLPMPPVIVQQDPRPRDLITAPLPATPQLIEVAEHRRPILLNADELADLDHRKALVSAFERGPVRIDIFATDPHSTLEQLRQSLVKNGFRWLTDPLAAERLKRRLPTRFMLYTDGLPAAEIMTAISPLATSSSFDSLVASPLSESDRKELTVMCGYDPFDAARSTAPLGHDPRKPLSDSTADQLIQSLQGQGGAKPSPRAILVTPYPLSIVTPGLRVTRKYFENRTRHAQATPVFIVVRELRP